MLLQNHPAESEGRAEERVSSAPLTKGLTDWYSERGTS